MTLKREDIKKLVIQEMLLESVQEESAVQKWLSNTALKGGDKLTKFGQKIAPKPEQDPNFQKDLSLIADFVQMYRDKVKNTNFYKKFFQGVVEEQFESQYLKQLKSKKPSLEDLNSFVQELTKIDDPAFKKDFGEFLKGLKVVKADAASAPEITKWKAGGTSGTVAPAKPAVTATGTPAAAPSTSSPTRSTTNTTQKSVEPAKILKPSLTGIKDLSGTPEYKKALDGLSKIVSGALGVSNPQKAQKIVDDIWRQFPQSGKVTKIDLLEQQVQINISKIIKDNGISGAFAVNLINKIKDWAKENSSFVTNKIGQQTPAPKSAEPTAAPAKSAAAPASATPAAAPAKPAAAKSASAQTATGPTTGAAPASATPAPAPKGTETSKSKPVRELIDQAWSDRGTDQELKKTLNKEEALKILDAIRRATNVNIEEAKKPSKTTENGLFDQIVHMSKVKPKGVILFLQFLNKNNKLPQNLVTKLADKLEVKEPKAKATTTAKPAAKADTTVKGATPTTRPLPDASGKEKTKGTVGKRDDLKATKTSSIQVPDKYKGGLSDQQMKSVAAKAAKAFGSREEAQAVASEFSEWLKEKASVKNLQELRSFLREATEEELSTLFDQFLKEKGKTLTPKQRSGLLSAFSSTEGVPATAPAGEKGAAGKGAEEEKKDDKEVKQSDHPVARIFTSAMKKIAIIDSEISNSADILIKAINELIETNKPIKVDFGNGAIDVRTIVDLLNLSTGTLSVASTRGTGGFDDNVAPDLLIRNFKIFKEVEKELNSINTHLRGDGIFAGSFYVFSANYGEDINTASEHSVGSRPVYANSVVAFRQWGHGPSPGSRTEKTKVIQGKPNPDVVKALGGSIKESLKEILIQEIYNSLTGKNK